MTQTQQVTVVFTDLVGSTELASRLEPHVADQVRATHFELLRGALTAHAGTEVKNLGDGLMVVFAITSGALNGAESMQQAIAQHNARGGVALSVRIGISLGEVTEDEGDYFGDAVVEAARLCARAEGGQILASQLVQLAAGRRARQDFVALGELELKGLPDPVPTVEVRWAPLPERAEGGPVPLPTRSAPTTSAGFIGRTSEREAIERAFKRVSADGRHQLVLIGGEPGMGKTTLATECAREFYDGGAIVLFGRSDEELAVPYGPWVEAISHLLAYAPAQVIESLGPQVTPLALLAPAIAAALGHPDPVPTSDPAVARFALYSAIAAVLRSAADIAPIVLILDDLHWADGSSLQLLRHIVRSEPMRVLVLGTFRESDVAADHPLADLLITLHREQGTERTSLRGLDDLDLLAMMEAEAGQSMDASGLALRDALMVETNGNPFFVGEIIRHLVESGGLHQEDGRWVASADLRATGLPVSVREVVGRRVARLGEPGNRVLSIASVIGRDFDLSLLAEVAELDVDPLLDIMDQASEATLVDNVVGNRYSFVHALVEHTLYDALSPARRARLHRRVAEAIEGQVRARPAGHLAELAYHWAQATTHDDLDKAVHYAHEAGNEALARYAPDDALRWYTQALTLLEQRPVGTEEIRCRLRVGLGDAQRQVGDPQFRETLLDAARSAQDLGATDLLVAAALANTRGVWSSTGSVDQERVAVLEAAVTAVAGRVSPELARLLAQLAVELTFDADLDRRRALVDEALAVARALQDPTSLVAVITAAVHALDVPETLAERLALGVEASVALQRVGDPALQFRCIDGCCHALFQAGDMAAGDASLARLAALAEQLGQPGFHWSVTNRRTARAMLAGDPALAEQLAFAAFELATSTGQPDGGAVLAAQLGGIRVIQGRADEIVDVAESVAADNEGIPGFAAFHALLCAEVGRHDQARAILAPFVAEGFALHRDLTWLSAMSVSAHAVAALGWLEAADLLFDQLEPFAGHVVWVGTISQIGVSYHLGALAVVLGRPEVAEELLAHSAELHARIGAGWGLALTQLARGQLSRANGDPGQASVMLEAALDLARQHGYGLIERHALAALAELD